MKVIRMLAASLVLLVQAALAQSLGEFARKERERKAQEQKASIRVSTDEVRSGKLDLSPPFDPTRKGDLDYLLQQLSHPKVGPELLAALIPHKDLALPRLLPMLGSTDPLKRVAPAVALMVLGSSEGLASMARLLNEAMETASSVAASSDQAVPQEKEKEEASTAASTAKEAGKTPGRAASSGEALRKKIEASRVFAHALEETKFGVWRFTEGSALTPDQVVQRLQKGPPIEIVGKDDNGQRIFNRALRDKNPNLRHGAIALVRVATGGVDYGFQPDQAAEQNESPLQQITNFLTTEPGKVISQLGVKTQE